MWWVVLVLALAGCARGKVAPSGSGLGTHVSGSLVRRPLPSMDASSLGVAYGPFRAGQRPGGPLPSADQILDDLRLLTAHFSMIRVYGAVEPTETALRTLEAHALPLQVLLGVWIAPDDPAANAREVEAAVRLATAFPDQVMAVSVGNETQVDWSAHRSDRGALIDAIRAVRSRVAQPVTTADDVAFWATPEAHAVAAEIDFLCLHAYAMWNGRSLDEAVPWTAARHATIAARYPDLPVALCEAGWATTSRPDGPEAQHVRAPAGEAEQARFYAALTEWARRERVPTFVFEAFDEPWKGADDPRDIEKHWGLYRVDRTPKAALEATP